MDQENSEPKSDLAGAIDFPVVGLGASAGGLEALQNLFAAVTDRPNMAFVLVQHLDPTHESMMAQLLSRRTHLPVRQIVDNEKIEQNTVYVIPPNAGLAIEGNRLRLTEFDSPRGLRRPIDEFFRSMASELGELAACVVLSGTGADGMMGLRAVKEHGGVTVAQDPDTARYDGMPLAAASTGLVDFILPPEQIIQQLENYFDSHANELDTASNSEHVAAYVRKICTTLNRAVGHDFSNYKTNTLVRRIQRRMRVVGIPEPDKYLAHLTEHDDECVALFRDLLINVTRFFRDREMFDALKNEILPKLLGEKTGLDEVRVWIPGCSSGEEAYSIAMMIADELHSRTQRPLVHIFATDIDEHMLQIGRLARYPVSVVGDLPAQYVERYTIAEEGHITISPKIRDMVRFSTHNMTKDPPFSRVDLLSCRNVLIYMDNSLQDRVLPIFHYSLRPDGVLILGPSETIGHREDLFDAIDNRNRIYRRLPGPASYRLLGGKMNTASKPARTRPVVALASSSQISRQTDLSQRLLSQYLPAYLVVNPDGDILSSSGKLSKYFEMPRGDMNHRLMTLARPGLRDALGQVFRIASQSNQRAARKDIDVQSEFGEQVVDVVADPLPDGNVLVVIQDVSDFRARLEQDYFPPQTPDEKTVDLEEELRQTRLRLRTTVEELETANEELRSSNEEMMSMNEELQSANEELTTVNEELKNKIDQLALANDDLSNFINSAAIPMVIVDDAFRIRLYTDAIKEIYALTPHDIGRPLTDFASSLRDNNLINDVKGVAKGGGLIKRTVMSQSGQRYTMRILPYCTSDGQVAGATITFFDITQILVLEDELFDKSQRLQLALDTVGMGVIEYDIEHDHLQVDASTCRILGLDPTAQLKMQELERLIKWDASEGGLDQVREALQTHGMYRGDFLLNGDGERWVTVVVKAIFDTHRQVRRVIGVLVEVTQAKNHENQQELLLREMNHRIKNLFATTSAIVYLSGEDAASVDEAVEGARGRIQALSRAHDVGQGRYSNGKIALRVVIEMVLQPYVTNERINVTGSEVDLPPKFITPMGLILHEWATNSIKYGALSSASGTITINWTHEGDEVSLVWRETGGPEIDREIEQKGFGSLLLNQSVSQMKAHLNVQWPSTGMVAELRFNVRVH